MGHQGSNIRYKSETDNKWKTKEIYKGVWYHMFFPEISACIMSFRWALMFCITDRVSDIKKYNVHGFNTSQNIISEWIKKNAKIQ